MVLVFDLDDTLYDELTYVKSGMSTVAAAISGEGGYDEKEVFELLWARVLRERGRVFDDVLAELGIATTRRIRRLVSLYRLHDPKLQLWPAARRCLRRLGELRMYIVTDGNQNVQQRKLRALGLYDDPRIRGCYLTYRYGRERAKPSPYCFELITRRERCNPSDVLYVADNPTKDFVGIKPLGFRTLRVLTGQHRTIEVDSPLEAQHRISSLDELTIELLEQEFANGAGRR